MKRKTVGRLAYVSGVLLWQLGLAHAAPVTGKILGPDGKPIVGAQVFILTDLTGFPLGQPLVMETDAAGAFKADLAPSGNPPNSYGVVTIYKPGYALGGGVLKAGDNVIKLQPPTQIRGSVKDAAGKPLAGVALMLLAALKDMAREDSIGGIVPDALKAVFSTVSNGDGTWVLPGPALGYKAFVLQNDPHYVQSFAMVDPDVPASGVLTVQPGAMVTGKVLGTDGKPAAGIKVSAGGGMGPMPNIAVTDADGVYHLGSLPPGPATLVAGDPTGQWVASVKVIATVAGQTAQAPNLVLTHGAAITGIVSDQATGAPLENVALLAFGPDGVLPDGVGTPVHSDKAGHFRVVVLPGKNSISIRQPPAGYLPVPQPLDTEVAEGQTKDVVVKLSRGLTAAGTATDAAGKPAPDVEIKATMKYVQRANEYMAPVSTRTDAAGKWQFVGLRPGTWQLTAGGAWDLVRPQEFKLVTGKPLAGQNLDVKHINLVGLSGRVVTKARQPVAGIHLKANVQVPDGPNSTHLDTQEVTTGPDGRFALGNLRPDVKVSFAATVPGYKYAGGGKVTLGGPGFEAQDIVLTPLSAKIEGRVLGADGKPAAAVPVMSPDGDVNAQTSTDAAGHFVLTSVPEGEVLVVAGRGTGLGDTRDATAKAPVTIALAPWQPAQPHDVQRAYDMLEELWATTEGAQYYRTNIAVTLAPEDPDLAIKVAARRDGTVDDAVLTETIRVLAETDPVRAAAWAPAHIAAIKDPNNLYTARANLALAIADLKPDLAREYYTAAKAYDKGETAKNPKDNQNNATRAILLSRLASRLHLTGEANAYAQMALTALQAEKNVQGSMVGPLLALNPDGVDKLLDAMPVGERVQALSNGVQEAARYDLTVARHILDKLIAVEATTPSSFYSTDGTQILVAAMGKQDPVGALALARGIQTRDSYNGPLTLAIAAQYQPRELALQVLHEAADSGTGQIQQLGSLSRIASMAYDLDPAFGTKLFEAARTSLDKGKAYREMQEAYGVGGDNTIAEFAYYYSRIDPAACRLMLESEFARQRQRPVTDQFRYFFINRSLEALIAAMAAIDVDRAQEMTWLLPPSDKDFVWTNPQADAQRSIAQYLLLTDTERHTKAFR